MGKSPFLDDNDFFKSHKIGERGELLIKSIPELPQNKPPKQQIMQKMGPKKPTPEVTKFKKKIESNIEELDQVIKDVVNQKGLTRSKYLVEKYTNFKSELQYCLNDMINYGTKQNNIDNDYDKTRVVINK